MGFPLPPFRLGIQTRFVSLKEGFSFRTFPPPSPFIKMSPLWPGCDGVGPLVLSSHYSVQLSCMEIILHHPYRKMETQEREVLGIGTRLVLFCSWIKVSSSWDVLWIGRKESREFSSFCSFLWLFSGVGSPRTSVYYWRTLHHRIYTRNTSFSCNPFLIPLPLCPSWDQSLWIVVNK